MNPIKYVFLDFQHKVLYESLYRAILIDMLCNHDEESMISDS